MAGRLVKKCPCLRPKIEEEIRVLDYRHSSLQDVPSEVFNVERTLEELYTDSNQIRDLPRELFYCHGIRKLSISDNEITSIPPAISSLANLEELDFSKNGVIDVPETIKGCKYLRSIDASVNPLGKLPEGFTQLANLTHLFLNDTFLDYLPGSFGRMTKLKILEMRENHLKTLPRSFGRLVSLERLDIGNNEFTELTDVLGSLNNLLELWCDNNQISVIHPAIGNLKQLMFLDASKNKLQELPDELEGCVSLADIHLTTNHLLALPDSIGNLNNLTTLKVDDNQLTSLPKTLGGLTSLSELNVSENDLEDLPASIGLLRNLRTFYADENLLQFIPAEVGSCLGITILSLRSNKLTYIPDEIGRIPRLRVLNLSDNLLRCLPFTIVKLKELQALWLTENQTRPLIPLQSDYEEETGRKILTCYLLPQGDLQMNDERDHTGDTTSFHASMWDEERLGRQQIHFDFNDNSDEEGTLVRCPTPYPKEMRGKVRHARNLAMRRAISDSHGKQDRDSSTEQHDKPERGDAAAARASVNFDEGSPHPGFGYSRVPESSDVRVREARVTKSTSPTLQESHRLYRYDKEKQQKDKARMQHRLSVPDIDSDTKHLIKEDSSRRGRRTNLARLSGSTPDLSSPPSDKETTYSTTSNTGVTAATSSSAAATTGDNHHDESEDLYQRQLLSQHRGRRSRRMREYDSDTGYRSSDVDGVIYRADSSKDYVEVKGGDTNSETMSVRSQPLPHRHHHRQHNNNYYHHHHNHHHNPNNSNHHQHRHRRRGPGSSHSGGGHSSDIESYGGIYGTANAAAAAYQQQQQHHQHRQQQQKTSTYHFDGGNPSSRVSTPTASSSTPHHLRPRSPSKSEPRSRSSDYLLNDSHSTRSSHGHNNNNNNNSNSRTAYNPNFISDDDYVKFSVKSSNNNNNTTNNNNINKSNESSYNSSSNLRTSNSNVNQSSISDGDLNQSSSYSLKNNSSSIHEASTSSVCSKGPHSNPSQSPHIVQRKSPGITGQAPPPVAPKPTLNTGSNTSSSVSLPPPVFHNKQNASSSPGAVAGKATPPQPPPPPSAITNSSNICAVSGATSASQGGHINYDSKRGAGNLYSLSEEKPSQRSTSNNSLPSSGHQQQATPPPYPSAPPYRRPSEGHQVTKSRTSSDSSSNNRDSPKPAVGGMSKFLVLGPSAMNKSVLSSPCGFHGNSPYSDLPPSSNRGEKLSYGDYTDVDRLSQGGSSSGGHTPQDNHTTRSGSSSSHIGSASQLDGAQPYHPHHNHHKHQHQQQTQLPHPHSHHHHQQQLLHNRTAVRSSGSDRNFSDSSDSRSDIQIHHTQQNRSSPHGLLYGIHKSSASSSPHHHDQPFDPYSTSFEVGNMDDMRMVPNQEQSSQVSSSTDSGYGHGHHVYERISDFSKDMRRGPGSHSSGPTSTPPSQRQTPTKRLVDSDPPSREMTPIKDQQAAYYPDSTTEHHRDEFRVTIQKNPGLGFSIAGGLKSMGNPFRANDKGIFVTKVTPDGPASTLLRPGDKLLEVNNINFRSIEHHQAVSVLKNNSSVSMLVERVQKVNMV